MDLPALARSCCRPVVRAIRHRAVSHLAAGALGVGGLAGAPYAARHIAPSYYGPPAPPGNMVADNGCSSSIGGFVGSIPGGTFIGGGGVIVPTAYVSGSVGQPVGGYGAPGADGVIPSSAVNEPGWGIISFGLSLGLLAFVKRSRRAPGDSSWF